MATDYQGNSRKGKEEAAKPKKEVEKVITGEVVIKKKSIGRKIKEIFIAADPKTVAAYVIGEVLLPAARNMVVDGMNAGISRMMYGDAARRYGQTGSRTIYNSPIVRQYPNTPYPPYPPAPPPGPRRNPARTNSTDTFLFSAKDDAERVLQTMQDIIDQYGLVSLADVNSMIGEIGNYTDEKWGWVILPGADIRQTRDGYLLMLPQAEAIQ